MKKFFTALVAVCLLTNITTPIPTLTAANNPQNAAVSLTQRYATMTSSDSYNPPHHTNDGNMLGALWRAVSPGRNVWLQADFNAPKNFNFIRIYQHGNRMRDYRLEYHDGTGWTTLHSAWAPPAAISTYFFNTTITAQTVRLSVAQSLGHNQVENPVTLVQFDIRYIPGGTPLVFPYSTPPGSGTPSNPWLLSDPTHLEWVNRNPEGHFRLMNNITAPDNFRIGAIFNGTFYGQGNTVNVNIRDLLMPLQFDAGLFAHIGPNGIIENLNVAGHVSGSHTVGGLAGMNDGIIRNASFEGTVSGTGNVVGGLVGRNLGRIEGNSRTNGNVSGNNNVGGLVGLNMAGNTIIIDSYSAAGVSGNNNIGGLVGAQAIGDVQTLNSRASGTVTGNNNVGHGVGFSNSGTIRWPVTFDLNGGEYNGSTANIIQEITHTTNATPPTPTREGNIFNGWNPANGYQNIINGLTLTAQWLPTAPPPPEPPLAPPPPEPPPEPPADTPAYQPPPPTITPPPPTMPTPPTYHPTEYEPPQSALAPPRPRTPIRRRTPPNTPQELPLPPQPAPPIIYEAPNLQTVIRLVINNLVYTVNNIPRISDVAPFIDPNHGRIMVPLRIIAEALGANVDWNENTREVIITKNNKTTILAVDTPLPDGMGTPIILNGRTLVPVRYVSEILGAVVEWDDTESAVYIHKTLYTQPNL